MMTKGTKSVSYVIGQELLKMQNELKSSQYTPVAIYNNILRVIYNDTYHYGIKMTTNLFIYEQLSKEIWGKIFNNNCKY